jgi:hypothetical protein
LKVFLASFADFSATFFPCSISVALLASKIFSLAGFLVLDFTLRPSSGEISFSFSPFSFFLLTSFLSSRVVKTLIKRGWPIVFIDHRGSNLKAITEVLEEGQSIPGSADFFLYRIKDLEAVLKSHENGEFGIPNNSYILMGHSLGALIALLYEGNKPTVQLEERCDSAFKDFAVTNLSKLLQCQISEIPFSEKNNANKASAIIGFNTFGSLVWPKENSSGIKTPTLLIGGTYDLITPLINEQFRVFSALNNPSNRFLIIEGASHFSPIRINNSYEENNDVFKISESFIGSNPILVQDLSAKFLVKFLENIRDQEVTRVIKNQKDLGLNFHLLDLETIKEVSKN